jgi:hypothetical protein
MKSSLTKLMLAMVLLPPITQPGRTRGGSGRLLCGVTEARPGSEEQEKHSRDVLCVMNYSRLCVMNYLCALHYHS